MSGDVLSKPPLACSSLVGCDNARCPPGDGWKDYFNPSSPCPVIQRPAGVRWSPVCRRRPSAARPGRRAATGRPSPSSTAEKVSGRERQRPPFSRERVLTSSLVSSFLYLYSFDFQTTKETKHLRLTSAAVWDFTKAHLFIFCVI